MSKRDHEVVEDYKKLFATMFQSPHLIPVSTKWYMLERGSTQLIHPIDDKGLVLDVVEYPGYISVDELLQEGWTVTPLLVYKVDTDKVR